MDQNCSNSSAEVSCVGCEKNMSHMDLNTRTAHVEKCLGLTIVTTTHEGDQDRQLDRLKGCPVCGSEWRSLSTPRSTHVQECANKHSLSLTVLNDLIDMFCESLNSGQQYRSKEEKIKASSFLKSFGGYQDRDDSADFQPMLRRRTPMAQTQIQAKRVSKKRQAVIDEFDNDLNEAKGLSLSLKRVTPDESSMPLSSKRKDRAIELAKSDILACEEAQNHIKQRAMAFKYQNEEKLSLLKLQQQERIHIENSIYLWNVGSLAENSPLLSKSCYYCPMLAKYLGE